MRMFAVQFELTFGRACTVSCSTLFILYLLTERERESMMYLSHFTNIYLLLVLLAIDAEVEQETIFRIFAAMSHTLEID
jgi:hypothetical protein